MDTNVRVGRPEWDVAIVGGGPAGMSAALVLGRCGRRVVVIDAGQRRNARAAAMHGYLTRDGISPREFGVAAREEVERYGVEFREGLVEEAGRIEGGGFWLKVRGGGQVRARRMLLATGVRDVLPRIEGFDEFYGASVHHCPYCDAWEHRGERIVAYGPGGAGKAAVGLALALRTWSEHVVACTDGERLSDEDRGRAERNGVEVREAKVVRLEGEGGKLRCVRLESGEAVECGAMFFNTAQVQRSDLPRRLGCSFKEDGGVETSDRQATRVRGLYLAGDADKEVQFVIVAAAEGATAGVAINRELQGEERGE